MSECITKEDTFADLPWFMISLVRNQSPLFIAAFRRQS